MNTPDPAIDEVREVRRQISEQFGHDPARLVDHYMKLQEQHRDRLVPSPKQSSAEKSASHATGWDPQFTEDAESGRLDALAGEALSDLRAGRTRPL